MFGQDQKNLHTKWFKFNLKRPHHWAWMGSQHGHTCSPGPEKRAGQGLIYSEPCTEEHLCTMLESLRNFKRWQDHFQTEKKKKGIFLNSISLQNFYLLIFVRFTEGDAGEH